jgi:hypothetical protein
MKHHLKLITLAFILDLSLSINFMNSRQWTKFKTLQRLDKLNVSEEISRSRIFFKNLNEINAHNTNAKKGLESYTMDVNQFTHLKFEEVIGFGQILKSNHLKLNASRVVKQLNPKLVKSSSTSFDLRNTGFVGPIKDQGKCG